jgi:hypothetical protein
MSTLTLPPALTTRSGLVVLIGEYLGEVGLPSEAGDELRVSLLRQGREVRELPSELAPLLRHLDRPRSHVGLTEWLEGSASTGLPTVEELEAEGLALILKPEQPLHLKKYRLLPRGSSLGATADNRVYRVETAETVTPLSPLLFWVWVWSAISPDLASTCASVAEATNIEVEDVIAELSVGLPGLLLARGAALDLAR